MQGAVFLLGLLGAMSGRDAMLPPPSVQLLSLSDNVPKEEMASGRSSSTVGSSALVNEMMRQQGALGGWGGAALGKRGAERSHSLVSGLADFTFSPCLLACARRPSKM